MPLTLPAAVALNLPNTGFSFARQRRRREQPKRKRARGQSQPPSSSISSLILPCFRLRSPLRNLRAARPASPTHTPPRPLDRHAQHTRVPLRLAGPRAASAAAGRVRQDAPPGPSEPARFGRHAAYAARAETSPLRRAFRRLTTRGPMLLSLSNQRHRRGDEDAFARGAALAVAASATASSQEDEAMRLLQGHRRNRLGARRPRQPLLPDLAPASTRRRRGRADALRTADARDAKAVSRPLRGVAGQARGRTGADARSRRSAGSIANEGRPRLRSPRRPRPRRPSAG